ncbi:MAG: hypothetical protein HFG02_02605 [Oscillibacter sp.]|nr:hypothetical protein [Oscillibacter sp.]
MKRLLSLALSAALLAALALPAAAAEESADARLAKVTQAVKSALSLNTDEYESFHGGVEQDLAPVWNLEWQGEKRSLSIQALEDGTVTYFYRWDYDPSPNDYRWDDLPAFPESVGTEDRAAAEDFLSRVLRSGEVAELKDKEAGFTGGQSGSSWEGTITLNGLPSPLHWHITVKNGQVTHFSRDVPETAFAGSVPAPDAQADRTQADGSLKDTLALRLEYVLEKPSGTRAILRYTPKSTHEFQVDAKTGEVLDVTELEKKLDQGYHTAAGGAAPTDRAESAADENGSLTEAEQEGVAQMEGILSKEELDKALRAESAYGLRGYSLISAAYEGGEEQVLCSLRYARTENGKRLTRNFSVDAKTGAVESVWSSAPNDREKTFTDEDALKKAEAFLKAWRPDRDLVLYQAGSEIAPWRMDAQPYWHFTFAQEVGGLPFRGNAVHVGIDGADGSIYSLSYAWDDAVTFDSASGLVSEETALAAWAGTYETTLAYRRVPQKLVKSDPVQARLLEQGMEYSYALRLTYGLEREGDYAGVDAKTGEVIRDWGNAQQPLAYTDLAGSAAKADIEKLAGYHVGFASDSFRPGKVITQWELVCLVYSVQGGALDPDARSSDGRESEYYAAYRLGLLTPAERNDGAVLTRGQVIKMLLNAAGYGPAARLGGGIFTCAYSDKGSIPEEDLGYAAIAQALGMASTTYAAARSATRGEAASMLCRVLERPA